MATELTRLPPRPLPPPSRRPLRRRLEQAHAREPFGPAAVRAGARRVAELAEQLGLRCVVHRGRVEVGGAELDHVFVVVEGCVVDATLPVAADGFDVLVRAWIAGDAGLHELERLANESGLDSRVLGSFPRHVTYRGAPLWDGTGRRGGREGTGAPRRSR